MKILKSISISTFILFFLSGNSLNIQPSPGGKEEIENEIKWTKPAEGSIANPFGNGYIFYGYYRAGHTGIDIKTKVGASVYSVDKGKVKYIKDTPNMRYGNYIVVEHDNNLYTLYAHLQKITVKLNQEVKKGEKIATAGVSGLASYPHLHFEVINRIPFKDGAWGYNYICKLRKNDKNSNVKKIQMELEKEPPVFDLLPLHQIKDEFNFLEHNYINMNYYYRMKNNHCTEVPIEPVTYFNPEQYLPKYEKSEMPNFNKPWKPKVVKKDDKSKSTKEENKTKITEEDKNKLKNSDKKEPVKNEKNISDKEFKESKKDNKTIIN